MDSIPHTLMDIVNAEFDHTVDQSYCQGKGLYDFIDRISREVFAKKIKSNTPIHIHGSVVLGRQEGPGTSCCRKHLTMLGLPLPKA